MTHRTILWWAIEFARLALAVAFCAAVMVVADGWVFTAVIGG